MVTAWILAIGRMLGLGSIAGIRPSLTLAVIGVVGYFDWGIEVNSTFSWLSHWLAIGTFVVLAILESTFDKISKVDRLQDRLIMPYRFVMGGVAGAATIPFGWQGVVVGAVAGAGAAWFAQYTKHLSRPKSVPSPAVVSLISTAEELGAFFGSVLVLAVPYFGYACVGVVGAVYWRVRTSRRSKYRKMRRSAARAEARAASGAQGQSEARAQAAPLPSEPPPLGSPMSAEATSVDGEPLETALGGVDPGEAVEAPAMDGPALAAGTPRDGGGADGF